MPGRPRAAPYLKKQCEPVFAARLGKRAAGHATDDPPIKCSAFETTPSSRPPPQQASVSRAKEPRRAAPRPAAPRCAAARGQAGGPHKCFKMTCRGL